jgi:hypothetical protein
MKSHKPILFRIFGGQISYDVGKRVPAIDKAMKILGFRADTKLSTMLYEVILWASSASKAGPA